MSRALLDRRALTLALLATGGLAVAALPAAHFPLGWVAAFVVPALALDGARRRGVRLWVAVAGCGAMYAALIAVAHATAGPLEPLTALGCSLLPPLAFLAARRHRDDALWALFLAFCVFLIGAILGGPSALSGVLFLAAASVTLQCEAAVRSAGRPAESSAAGSRSLVLRSLAANVAAVLVACVLCFQLLLAVSGEDSGSSGNRALLPRPRAGVGLDDRFEFGDLDQGGSGLDLSDDRIVRVRAPDGQVEHELYLRALHFDVPGLDRWSTEHVDRLAPIGPARASRLRVPTRDVAVQRLDVEILGPAGGFAFVPVGAVAIEELAGLVGDVARAAFRRGSDDLHYRVAWQDLREAVADARVARATELTRLPRELEAHRALFAELVGDARADGAESPAELAEAIARVLQRRCKYALREPRGPHAHSLLNFLTGERVGFCMHYASVTAICLRLCGVPARIGVGLYGGEEVEGAPDQRVFGSQHAHAWVEIPYEELGWVPFDPTPPGFAGQGADALPIADAGIAPSQAPPEPADTAQVLAVWTEPLEHAWLWLGIIAFGVGFAMLRRRGAAPAGSTAHEGGLPDPEQRTARGLLERLLAELGRIGRPRSRGESLEGYAAALAADERVPAARVWVAFHAYQEVRFGGQTLDASRRVALESAIDAVLRARDAESS
jgi:transglutaminase-like putative cysteine protease